MSTCFYNLRAPIDDIEIERDEQQEHTQINLLNADGKNIGTLTITTEIQHEIIKGMIETDPAADRVGIGGKEVAYVQHRPFTSKTLLSDYLETVSTEEMARLVAETREKAN